VDETQRMHDAIVSKGNYLAKMTIYPEAGHDSWTETYNNPELYDWLLSHKQSDQKEWKPPAPAKKKKK
ncbi:MAG: phospholipase, partial [Verrucomicrobiota bacterium]